MPDAPLNQLSYLGLDRPVLPYRTNTSPIDESPHWVNGSSNTMATIRGEVQKRPGFASIVETALSVIPGTVRRLYTWRRFSGSFFVMASVETTTAGSLSQVWKLEVGVDSSFSMIYADNTSATSQPFDFTTSNNFVFFGNGTTRQNMRKYNGTAISPIYQSSLWGLDFPIAAPATALVSPQLPPGLTFNGTSLSGIPVTPGNYSVIFTATDTSGDTVSQSMSFSISTNMLDWRVPSSLLPFGVKGQPYSNFGLQPWGGTAPYAYTLESGSIAPGLSVNQANGDLFGTPTAPGNYIFAIKVTDAAGASITRVFSQFIGDPTISIAPPAPNTATIGVPYSSSITPAGGTAPYSYAIVANNLPPGMFLNALGGITGSPASSGVYPVTFQVTDSAGHANQVSVSYTVSSSALAIATQPTPPSGKVGYAYSFTPFASGGTSSQTRISPPFSGQVTNGSGNWGFAANEWRSNFNPGTSQLSNLIFQNFGLSIPPTATILGVSATISLISQATTTGTVSQISLYESNAPLGTVKTPSTPFTTVFTPQSYGGATDLWGAALTPAILNNPTFGYAVACNADSARLFIGQPFSITVNYSYPSSGITITAAPNAITAQTGYIYGQTFTSIYGHESSMSALSASTGIFTSEAVQVNLLSSADLQVNGINLYRTTDGGDADPAAMRLVASLPNVDSSYTDSTLDIYLGLQTGPALFVNDPPQPLSGFVWSNGRIWGKTGAYTWFTGNEEITNGIPAECMSDATNGNYYGWPSEVGGLAVTSNGVDIGLDEQFWQISGDTLATFRKSKLLQGGGTRYPINIISVGDDVYWLDTSKQAWTSTAGEFGEPIRPDLANMTLQFAFIGFHKSKLYNWIYVLDAVNSVLYVYNLDLNQWNTPWRFTPDQLVPNGNFDNGLQGWAPTIGATGPTQIPSGLELTPSSSTQSGTFPVVPGQQYVVSFTGAAESLGTNEIFHRIFYSPTYNPNTQIDGTTAFTDFLSAGSISTTLQTYSYLWTCPAGMNFASAAMYQLGNVNIYYTDVSVERYAGKVTAITSGETSVGNIELIAAFDTGHVMYLDPNSFTDDGVEYGETLVSNLLPVVPGRGTTARNAAEVRRIAQFDMEVSAIQSAQEYIPRSPEYFGCLIDDDPSQSTQDQFFDLSGNITDPQYQDQTIQKRYIIPKRWMVDQAVPMGRRVAFQAQWNPSTESWAMYSVDVGWRT